MGTGNSARPQRLIYGCMGLGGPWDGTGYASADIDQAGEAIEAARAIGIRLFDLADIYRQGKSEAVVGEVLARSSGLRETIALQTKCGIRLGENGLATHYDLGRESILQRVGASLRRLQTDYLDVLMLHRPDPLMDVREVAAAVGTLMAEGTVRAVGVSNMSGAQIAYLQDALETPLVANQLEMSLARRAWLESSVLVNHDAGREYNFPHGTLEHCLLNGIELQAYGSLARGRFTGASESRPTPADRAVTALLGELAAEHATTAESVLLGWLMRHPAGISPVIGTTSAARIAACAAAARVGAAMSRTDWYRVWVAARGSELP